MLPLERAVGELTQIQYLFRGHFSVDYVGVLSTDPSIKVVYHGGRLTRHETVYAIPADREFAPTRDSGFYPMIAYNPFNGGAKVSQIWDTGLRELLRILRKQKIRNPLTLFKLSNAIRRIDSQLKKNMRG